MMHAFIIKYLEVVSGRQIGSIGIKHFFAVIFIILSNQSEAQQTVRILTPDSDTCLAYTQAMEATDNPALTAALGGWALGFFSGVAQGTGIDYLRDADASGLFHQLYSECLGQPRLPLSVVAEHMARDLIAARQRK